MTRNSCLFITLSFVNKIYNRRPWHVSDFHQNVVRLVYQLVILVCFKTLQTVCYLGKFNSSYVKSFIQITSDCFKIKTSKCLSIQLVITLKRKSIYRLKNLDPPIMISLCYYHCRYQPSENQEASLVRIGRK